MDTEQPYQPELLKQHRVYIAMKWKFLVFFLSFVAPAMAQQTPYCVHVSDASTGADIASIQVKVKAHGIVRYTSQTDFDGRVYFPVQFILDSNNVISFSLMGLAPEEIKAQQVEAGKTLELRMKTQALEMEEYVLTSYKIPLIEKEKSRKKHRKKKRKQETAAVRDTIAYTAGELADFEKLKGEGWDLTDSISEYDYARASEMKLYYAKKLTYPSNAVKYGLEERLFFGLQVSRNGKKIKLKLLKGKNPALALAAARVIARSPKWKFEEPVTTHQLVIHLPINFVLK